MVKRIQIKIMAWTSGRETMEQISTHENNVITTAVLGEKTVYIAHEKSNSPLIDNVRQC